MQVAIFDISNFYLDGVQTITLMDGKMEYLAFKGMKRFLGINPLAGPIKSRSGQIWWQFGGICKFSWHRICIYRKKAVILQQPLMVGIIIIM